MCDSSLMPLFPARRIGPPIRSTTILGTSMPSNYWAVLYIQVAPSPTCEQPAVWKDPAFSETPKIQTSDLTPAFERKCYETAETSIFLTAQLPIKAPCVISSSAASVFGAKT